MKRWGEMGDESDLEEDLPGQPRLPRELGYYDSDAAADFWFLQIQDAGHVWQWNERDSYSPKAEAMGMYARYFFRLLERANPFTHGKVSRAEAMSAEIIVGVMRRAKAAMRARGQKEVREVNYYCTSVERDGGETVVRLQAFDEKDGDAPRGRVTLKLTGDPELGPFTAGEKYELALRGLHWPQGEQLPPAPPPETLLDPVPGGYAVSAAPRQEMTEADVEEMKRMASAGPPLVNTDPDPTSTPQTPPVEGAPAPKQRDPADDEVPW